MICLAVTVAPASADPINDYRRNGTINPCKYSDGQLKQGLGNLPPDVQQYAPGLADQLRQGREGCGGGSTGSGTTQTQAVPGPGNPTNCGGGGSAGAVGTAAAARPRAKILDPPAPKASARTRLADISTPPVSQHFNKGAPGWLAPLMVGLLVLAALFALVRFAGLGARFPRSRRRPRPPAGDMAAQLWDSVRLGR